MLTSDFLITMPSISETWGTEPQERRLAFPCDGIISEIDAALFRGVTINASAKTLFRWLCQMRVAPYSYDWIDNFGTQSPPQLIPGLDNLDVGQDVMRIFSLVAFEQDRHLTIRVKPRSDAFSMFWRSRGKLPGRASCRSSSELSFTRQVSWEVSGWTKGKDDASFAALGRLDNDASPTA